MFIEIDDVSSIIATQAQGPSRTPLNRISSQLQSSFVKQAQKAQMVPQQCCFTGTAGKLSRTVTPMILAGKSSRIQSGGCGMTTVLCSHQTQPGKEPGQQSTLPSQKLLHGGHRCPCELQKWLA